VQVTDRPASARPRRVRRILAWVLGSIGALLVVAILAVVVWSQVGVMAAEPEPLAAVRADPAIAVTDDDAAIVLSPAEGAGETGLVFIPGAKVDPWAYASTLSGLVADEGMTVVITKPWLNLAFFDLRSLDAFTGLSPDTDSWIVGGHSLGGVRACQLATDADALALFGPAGDQHRRQRGRAVDAGEDRGCAAAPPGRRRADRDPRGRALLVRRLRPAGGRRDADHPGCGDARGHHLADRRVRRIRRLTSRAPETTPLTPGRRTGPGGSGAARRDPPGRPVRLSGRSPRR
jgi:hypothetical protein